MADPMKKTEELVREAELGRSERTPWITLGAIQLAAIVAIVVLLAIAFTAYALA